MLSFATSIIGIALLLSLMYFYMYKRMSHLNKAVMAKTYKPNLVLSILEIIMFIVVYTSCAIIVTVPDSDLVTIIVVAAVAFMVSILAFNISFFEKFGKKLFYVGAVLMTVYYLIVGLTL